MREDMDRVIIERGRSHGGCKYKVHRRRLNQINQEDIPLNEGMRRPYGYDTKNQRDVLGPLRKYLHKQVGRLWDDIYSEICSVTDTRTIRGHHLRSMGTRTGHIFDRLDVHGIPGRSPRRYLRRTDYYLNEDGILRAPEVFVGDVKPNLSRELRDGVVVLNYPSYVTKTTYRTIYRDDGTIRGRQEYSYYERHADLLVWVGGNHWVVIHLMGRDWPMSTPKPRLLKNIELPEMYSNMGIEKLRYLNRREKEHLGIR